MENSPQAGGFIGSAIERVVEVLLFSARWIMAPIYLGLVVGLIAMVVKSLQHIAHVVPRILSASGVMVSSIPRKPVGPLSKSMMIAADLKSFDTMEFI